MNKIDVAQIFTDNMVLQRDMSNPIWGKASNNSRIKVKFCGQIHETEAVNGKWRVSLSPLSAGGPYELEIECGNTVIIIKNILIGEVWIAGGQSNMEYMLKDSLNGQDEICCADYGNIRYYDVPKIAFEDTENENTDITVPEWKICNPENAGKFSAVAYHFSKQLWDSLKVPIGIIGCNWGGTSASCWMSEKYLASDKKIKAYLDEYKQSIQNISDEEFELKNNQYNRSVEEYLKNVELFVADNPGADAVMIDVNVGPFPWPPPLGRKSFRRPAGLYNTMVKKIYPYGIKGVIFYQGEEDTSKSDSYSVLFSKMIENWRDDWNNPHLPFLFVQLPYFGCGANFKGQEWAILREQQLLVSQEDINTAMAVIIDCGERENIHPVNKKPVGERLALLAKAKIYGQDVKYSGPVFKYMNIAGNKATIYFDHAESGLIAEDGKLKGFEICGEDWKFVDAQAVILNNAVEVFSQEVQYPVAVRYGFANYMDINYLFNDEHLPAGPFRSDKFQRLCETFSVN